MIAATGAQAAAAAESLVCGLAAVTLPAVAQGIALSGHRAASLAWEGAGDLASNLAGFPAGYVQHRRRRGGDRTAAAVELTPGSVQEAADYALVAHRIADRIGRPVVCSMDEGLAESLGFVRLPAPDVVRGLFGDKSAAAPADRGEEHLARVADEAFRDVALATRRPCQVVTRYQTGDADVVLVAGGYDADRAHAAAGILRDRGHKAGVVSVGLIRPFPKAAIVDALSGKARVIVIGSGDLFLVVGDALAKAGAKPAAFESYTPAGGGALAIVSRVAGENGTPIPGFAGWRVASRPAGAWSERLLRDLAAGIALRTPVDVATSAPAAGTAVLEISARGYGAEASSEDAAGTLFVAHPSLVDPNDAAIAGGGTLVLNAKAAGPAGAWRLLSETQRRMIEDRKIAAYAVDLASATSGASDRAAAVRWAAAGALLSAARESAAPIVRAGDVTDAVREA
ncbi:hypothetical protein K8I61_04475, partial [bacterium]|nr:hypothetical protein [bacterium]